MTGRTDRRRSRRLLVAAVVAALVATIAIRALLVESFYVPSESMAPTLQPADRVLVTKWGSEVSRGDIVVFDGGTFYGTDTTNEPRGVIGRVLGGLAELVGVDPGEAIHVKRVIGVGGDRVTCCDADGRMSINGETLAETYLPAGVAASQHPFDVVVPADRLWVMGDNRPESRDSRDRLGSPGGGMLAADDVIGTVSWRYWPLARWGSVDDTAAAAAGIE